MLGCGLRRLMAWISLRLFTWLASTCQNKEKDGSEMSPVVDHGAVNQSHKKKRSHLIRAFVRALHAFYGVEGPRLDVLRLYDFAEGPLALLGHQSILPHGRAGVLALQGGGGLRLAPRSVRCLIWIRSVYRSLSKILLIGGADFQVLPSEAFYHPPRSLCLDIYRFDSFSRRKDESY